MKIKLIYQNVNGIDIKKFDVKYVEYAPKENYFRMIDYDGFITELKYIDFEVITFEQD